MNIDTLKKESMQPLSERLVVLVTPAFMQTLNLMSRAKNQSVAYIVRDALKAGLLSNHAEFEDLYDEMLEKETEKLEAK